MGYTQDTIMFTLWGTFRMLACLAYGVHSGLNPAFVDARQAVYPLSFIPRHFVTPTSSSGVENKVFVHFSSDGDSLCGPG